MRKAIIGGTGVYQLEEARETQTILTAFGSVSYDIMSIEGQEIVFLARHGSKHALPPHKINYRANMMALKMLEVDEILATCAVGSMNDAFAPGDIVVIHDFIDFTKNRPQSFYEGDDTKVVHVEMTDPYCSNLRSRFLQRAGMLEIMVQGEAIYVCTEGPRFETASEIRMYRQLGGDVVGMTNVPEVVLAKELGMCYAAVGIITNWCTGIEGNSIEGHQIDQSMALRKNQVTKAFVDVLTNDPLEKSCACSRSLIVL